LGGGFAVIIGQFDGIADVMQFRVPHGEKDHATEKENGETEGAEDEGEAFEKPVHEESDGDGARGGEAKDTPGIGTGRKLVVENIEQDEAEEAKENEHVFPGVFPGMSEFLRRIVGVGGFIGGVVSGGSAHGCIR
jgi:hypothetical protein